MPRAKQFDPDQALAKAMEVFWARGYEATSVQNLVDAMGINRFSLYETFGDKHALYLAALDRYGNDVARDAFVALESAEDGAAAIRDFFQGQVARLETPGEARGCMVANCAAEMAARDEDVARRVRRNTERAERAFRVALDKAAADGKLTSGLDRDDLARFFAATSLGLMVVGKASPGRAFLESVVRVVLSTVASPTS